MHENRVIDEQVAKLIRELIRRNVSCKLQFEVCRYEQGNRQILVKDRDRRVPASEEQFAERVAEKRSICRKSNRVLGEATIVSHIVLVVDDMQETKAEPEAEQRIESIMN